MANKVSIFITNLEGRHFELTNEKMAIMMACESSTNWNVVFDKPVFPYDIIISDFHNSKAGTFGLGYSFVQHCDTKEDAEKIIRVCREKLHAQYERMMFIRVAKKYNLDEMTRLKIEMEYHNSDNYEVRIRDIF